MGHVEEHTKDLHEDVSGNRIQDIEEKTQMKVETRKDGLTGTPVFRNMSTPFFTSASATSCGVLTITIPSILTSCASVSCTSPVPGGRSTTRTSSPGDQSTSKRSCCVAFCTIRPRQTTAFAARELGARRKEMDMARRLWFEGGRSLPPVGGMALVSKTSARGSGYQMGGGFFFPS